METSTPTIETLPVEILDNIFDIIAAPLRRRKPNDPFHKTARGWLAQCHETSRAFRARARPQLFRQVTISVDMGFPMNHVEAFLELGKDAESSGGGAVGEVREFVLYEVHDEMGIEPVKTPEEDIIGKVIQMLLDLAKAGNGQLQAVAVIMNGRNHVWGDLASPLRKALEECYAPGSPVKNLWLNGIYRMPLSLLVSSQLTSLCLKKATVELGDRSAPALVASGDGALPAAQTKTPALTSLPPNPAAHIRNLTIAGVGNVGELALDLDMINALGPQLGTLEVWIKRRWTNPTALNLVGSLPTTPSARPAFPNLTRLRVGVYLNNHRAETWNQEDPALNGYLTFKDLRWVELAKQFLITVPASHTPLLEQLDIVLRPLISQPVQTMDEELTRTKGWATKEWDAADEQILNLLQTRTQRQGALALHVRIFVCYVYNYMHRCGDHKPPHTDTEEGLWTGREYPRIELPQLLPRTMESFADSLSLHEDFSITYTFCPY